MKKQILSKSLAGPSELVLVMPIRKGFVDCLDTRTYRSRLKTVAEVFSNLRSANRESRLRQPLSDVVDRIRTIFSVHIAVLDPDKLLLTVAFDQPWEPYIRVIWRDLGKLLDPILCNCEDYVGIHSSDQGYKQFAAWIRKHQVNTDIYYVRDNHTVDDLIYLDQLEQLFRGTAPSPQREYEAAAYRLKTPEAIAAAQRPDATTPDLFDDFIKLGAKAVTAFHTMTYLYPKGSADHEFLIRAAKDVLREFPPSAEWLPSSAAAAIKRLFKTELDWFEQAIPEPMVPADTRPALKPTAIQGGIKDDYGANVGCMLLFSINGGRKTRKFLSAFADRVTTATHATADGVYRNIAFTLQGLRRMGLTATQLDHLPQEFREGMAARAGILGDIHANHPDQWKLPRRNWPLDGAGEDLPRINLDAVDIVVQLRTSAPAGAHCAVFNEKHPLWCQVSELAAQTASAMQLLAVEPMYQATQDEHFGFRDGISQPQVTLSGCHDDSNPDAVRRGDLFLGYANSRFDPDQALPAQWDAGTFLVVRKLSQDVAAYNEFVEEQCTATGIPTDDIHAKLMGRHKNGVPLTSPPSTTAGNEFDFREDDGSVCPMQAHIRRANPRDGKTVPRIMRRGMSYGDAYDPEVDGSDAVERGLVFQAYNASIAEQFEVIQRWLMGGNRTGHYSRQNDTFLGVPCPGEERHLKIPYDKSTHQVENFPIGKRQFVTLEWGVYLFVPSLTGLAAIAAAVPEKAAANVSHGAVLIADLQKLAQVCPNAAAAEWKRLLEERDALDDGDTQAVWAAIRANHKGILRTPAGTLVASAELVEEVLTSPDRFTVDTYAERLSRCIGPNYLGLNPPEHERDAAGPNEVIAAVGGKEAFDMAYEQATRVLGILGGIPGDLDIPLLNFADIMLSVLAKEWYGIPDGPTVLESPHANPTPFIHAGGQPLVGDIGAAHCPYHFTSPSRYVFQPRPSAVVGDIAEREGQTLLAKVEAYVAATPDAELAVRAREIKNALVDPDQFASVLLGALLGFMPTVHGNLVTVLREWVRNDILWRLQDDYLADGRRPWCKARAIIEPALTETMVHRPVPSMVHRQVKVAGDLGGVWVEEGAQVVVGLVSAATAAQSVLPIFGGDYFSPHKPTHACPGRKMGLGVLLGVICAFLEVPGTLRRTPSTLVVTLQRD